MREHPDRYAVKPRSAPIFCRGSELRSPARDTQRRGLDSYALGALGRKGDEWRGPFATESTERIRIMTAGLAIIGMTTAARQLLNAAETVRTSEYAAADQLADAIACAQEAYRALTGNTCETMPV